MDTIFAAFAVSCQKVGIPCISKANLQTAAFYEIDSFYSAAVGVHLTVGTHSGPKNGNRRFDIILNTDRLAL